MRGWLIVALLALITLGYYVIAFNLEYSGNQLFKQNYDKQDYAGAFSSMFVTDPDIGDRPYLGNQSAPLTIIIAVDFSSQESKQAYLAQASWLMKEYVETGKARLYHKYYLPQEDYTSKGPRYEKALAAICYSGNDTIGMHASLFDTLIIADCDEPAVLYLDVLETEELMLMSPSITIGIDGRDNTVVYGIPDPEYIQKRLRSREIKVGI